MRRNENLNNGRCGLCRLASRILENIGIRPLEPSIHINIKMYQVIVKIE